MNSSTGELVQLNFSHDEKEFLAAMRFYVLHSKELLVRVIVIEVLLALILLLLNVLLDFTLPLWAVMAFIVLASVAWMHGFFIDIPRARFRGDPKFRDEFSLTFTDSAIDFKTANMKSTIAWSFYTGVIENDSCYILIYGKNIHSLTVLPKRAFRSSEDEAVFRRMLRRHIDSDLKLSEREQEYVPKSLEPPNWR
jgi:hypothetical protein